MPDGWSPEYEGVAARLLARSALGLGELTHPKIDRTTGRIVLFEFMRLKMQPELKKIRAHCLPLYRELRAHSKDTCVPE